MPMARSAGLQLRPRTLLGPGPSNVHPLVYAAMQTPVVGHLDPQFLEVMVETQEMLRAVFVTGNRLTLPVSGTGSAGMEASLVNLIERGDEALVCVAGYFAGRMCEMVERMGGVLHRLERPWGEVFTPEEVAAALERWPATRVVAVVHGETSTGALQPLPALGELCRSSGRLLIVDAVATLGGVELPVDEWQIDACYSGSQKCLSAPPGLAPLTFGPRAVERLRARSTKVASWYLDVSGLETYWTEGKRAYHHTAPVTMNYALHQALALVLAEGLPARFARHRLHSRALLAGIEVLGFTPLAAEGCRMPMVNALRVPAGVDEAGLRRRLMEEHSIEVAGGLGPLAGQIWRVGLMGESCTRHNVETLLAALEGMLPGADGRARAAAAAVYAAA
jgi:alanine-glyoxylate transaminase/serine-glyoxylate transaminase/serine-pyruvate transaminase